MLTRAITSHARATVLAVCRNQNSVRHMLQVARHGGLPMERISVLGGIPTDVDVDAPTRTALVSESTWAHASQFWGTIYGFIKAPALVQDATGQLFAVAGPIVSSTAALRRIQAGIRHHDYPAQVLADMGVEASETQHLAQLVKNNQFLIIVKNTWGTD